MESCGVSQCENGGELWMCVTIRFPMLPGSVFSIELTDFLDSDLSPQSRSGICQRRIVLADSEGFQELV